MRCIDADALVAKMNLAIAMLKRTMKNFDIEDDPECQMELKAYQDIRDGIKEEPTIEPEHKKDAIQKFNDYQVEWLLSHCDLELEPQLEEWVVRFLHDTANRYTMEIGREEGEQK